MSSPRLAIIGAGCSGLVTLKLARDQLPDWEIVCFEKSSKTVGCWGNPYPGFVSTSTKYTTQFSSHRKWNAKADPAQRAVRGVFFVGDVYGRYLESFVADKELEPPIRLRSAVRRIRKDPAGWRLWIDDGTTREEVFDRLIICTGLAEKAKAIDSPVPILPSLNNLVSNSRVVVIGGGESAADIAPRLAASELGNEVYLSLKTGIRVSPR